MSDASELVGELVGRRPLAFSILKAKGIDPGASMSLESACRLRALDPATLLDDITRAEQQMEVRWAGASLSELIDNVLSPYHAGFAAQIDVAQRAIERAGCRCAPAAHPPLTRLVHELRIDIESHIRKEESVLFPWLRNQPRTAAAPMRAMVLEHADTVLLLHAIHVAAAVCLGRSTEPTARAARQHIATLETSLCEHMHLENEELLRRALASRDSR